MKKSSLLIDHISTFHIARWTAEKSSRLPPRNPCEGDRFEFEEKLARGHSASTGNASSRHRSADERGRGWRIRNVLLATSSKDGAQLHR